MGKPKDIITEEEFNRMVKFSPSSSPRQDSPGDSESDALAEIEMGFDFGDGELYPREDEEDIAAFDQSAADDRTKFSRSTRRSEDEIAATGKAVSSDLPSPRADREEDSSTH